jgi:hypothetical protein
VTIAFAPATRAATKARIALAGPSGSGKTYTALALGHAMAEAAEGRLAVIDTERGKSQMYKGINGWDFDVFAPQTFAPASLTEALGVAAGCGYPVVVLDSWSHYWSGIDGMLEQVDRRAKGGNNFSGWKEVRPEERRMIDAIVSAPFHVIVTLRVKTEYVIELNDRGKNVPRKIGLKPEQREGMEYEFDVIGDMDLDNLLTVSKTRIPPLHGAAVPKPGAELATTIVDWLSDGEDIPGPMNFRAEALTDGVTIDGYKALYSRAKAAGLINAPVTDEDGNPTVLGDLIVSRGKALPAGGS